VFFLHRLERITEKEIKGYVQRIKKGDVILAISVTQTQRTSKQRLVDAGFKIVKSMVNPNSDNTLNLHLFKKK
jgi:hypothetical protein